MVKIEEGQIWRKQGPYDWIKIEKILDPRHPNYDGGLPGCVVRCFPPQLKGIQCRGGVTRYIAGSEGGLSWEEQVQLNRFLLKDGWKRGASTEQVVSSLEE